MRIPFTFCRYKNSDPQTWQSDVPNYQRPQLSTSFGEDAARVQLLRVHAKPSLVWRACPRAAILWPLHTSAPVRWPPRIRHRIAARHRSHAQHVGLDVKFTAQFGHRTRGRHRQTGLLAGRVQTSRRSPRTNDSPCSFRKSVVLPGGVDLLQTPIQAVYTRTITAPAWGGRINGKAAGVRYTALVADDDGGGSVVLPAHAVRRSRLRTSPRRCLSHERSAISVARSSACS